MNEKSIFRFLFFELWSFLYLTYGQSSMNFHPKLEKWKYQKKCISFFLLFITFRIFHREMTFFEVGAGMHNICWKKAVHLLDEHNFWPNLDPKHLKIVNKVINEIDFTSKTKKRLKKSLVHFSSEKSYFRFFQFWVFGRQRATHSAPKYFFVQKWPNVQGRLELIWQWLPDQFQSSLSI